MNRTAWYLGLLVIAGGITLTAIPLGGTGGFVENAGDNSTSDTLPVSLVATDNVVRVSNATTDGTTSPRSPTGTIPVTRTAGTASESAGGTPVAALINDLETPVEVAYGADTEDETIELLRDDDRITIHQGSQHLLMARCSPESADAGSTTLRVTIQETTVEEPVAQGIVLTVEVQYDCPETSDFQEMTEASTMTRPESTIHLILRPTSRDV